jgi:Protein of unknown function (DUF2752)
MTAIAPYPTNTKARYGRNFLRLLIMLAGGLVLTVAIVVYYRFDPATTIGFPQCLFYRATNLFCPGCGSQRALHQLLHGHLLAAMHDNVLICVAIPLLLWEMAAKIFRGLPVLLNRPKSGWIVVWIMLAFWILRNIPVWPCNLLAPV